MFRIVWLAAACLAISLCIHAEDAVIPVPGAERPFFPEGKPLEGLVITLDAGHGGFSHQPGYSGSARGVNSGVVEENLNMLVTAQARWHLINGGAQVHMTRWDDRKVTLDDSGRAEELGARPAMAEKTRSHLFLSLHHNSAPRVTADGVVILIWPTDKAGADQPLERAFAAILREEVEKKVHHAEPFGPWINEHPLVADSDLPSACVEFGFLSNPEFDAWVSQRGSHRAEAIGIYNAVVRMWAEHREALEAKRLELFPDVAQTPAPAPEPPEGWQRNLAARGDIDPAIKGVARQVWALERSPETAAEAQWLLATYRKTCLSDSTSFYFGINASKDAEGWRLTGATDQPILREAAAGLMRAVGCEPLTVDVAELPAAKLGDKIYGVVQIPMALTWGAPKEGADVQTQLLLGEPVWLLDENEDGTYYLLHGGDGYIGWVRREAVRRLTAAEFEPWTNAPRAIVQRDIMVNDFRIPAGAGLPVIEESATSVTLRLPQGVRSTQRAEQATVAKAALRMPPATPTGVEAVRAGIEYLTVPYVFGGRSRLGLDCSGFTGVAWATTGLTLPRDARQQVLVGRMTATRWNPATVQPGDLLYFLDRAGRVFHVTMSLGGARFIHSSPPEVHVGSFDEKDELYTPEWGPLFAFARRPM